MERTTWHAVAGLILGALAALGWWLASGLRRLRVAVDELRVRVERVERVEQREAEPALTVEVRGLLPDRGTSRGHVDVEPDDRPLSVRVERRSRPGD